ncbi:MAG: SAM-dependent methyltransferase [Deltaproteobacteria bacterium]|nr:MAG: SAM-dependent methyltransferase [Deltaproteobacteria bacterium]
MITGFESINNWYEKPLGHIYFERVSSKLDKLLRPHNTRGKPARALDAGCGSGQYTLYLASNYTYNTVGIDKSRILVSKAFKKSEEKNLKVDFLNADIFSLPFKSESFGLVLCINVIEFVQNKIEAVGELKRVLSPEGILILGVCNKYGLWGLIKTVAKPFKRGDPFFKGNFLSRNDIKDIAQKTGLKLLHIEEEIYFLPFKDIRAITLSEKIIKRYLKSFSGLLIACLKK